MQVTKINIKNFMGIKDLELKPSGNVTVITGQNGIGKTSIIEAIKSVFKVKANQELINYGADKSEIYMELDDGHIINRTIKADKSNLTVKREGFTMTKPQAWLEEVVDFITINPINFIYAKPSERIDILLDSIDVELNDDTVHSYMEKYSIRETANVFDTLAAVRKRIYDERTGINRANKEAQSALNQLRSTVETLNIPDNLDKEIAHYQAEDERIETALAQESGLIEKKFAETKESLLQKEAREIEEIKRRYENYQKKALEEYLSEKEKVSLNYAEQRGHVKSTLATLYEKNKQKGAFDKTKELINQYAKQVDTFTLESKKADDDIEYIDKYKQQLLSQSPIPGLEIEDGEIYYTIDNSRVAFDMLNTATQLMIAVKVAILRSKELNLICIDGAERLDANNFNVLEELLAKHNLQAIITKVEDKELTINNLEQSEIF